MKDKEPITETPFKRNEVVICGRCRGMKQIEMLHKTIDCPLCLGTGTLVRNTEGVVKIFIND